MKKTLSILLCLWYALPIFSQQTLNGTIFDAGDGQPLIGASVQLKGNSNIGAITDLDGSFKLVIPPGDSILLVSYTGYKSIEANIIGRTSVDIALTVSATTLDEVVVIGYGTQQRADVTGSISRVEAEVLEKAPVTSLEGALHGRAAGVFIGGRNGKLVSNISVRIRGVASINASSEPLYVVDGIVINTTEQLEWGGSTRDNVMSNIDFNDIASIDILKDASATAIYGARASNGVIIITTKQGRAGRTKVELDLRTGWSKPTRKRKWLNAAQYLELWEEAFNNVAQADGTVSGLTANEWRDSRIPGWDGGHDTNWENEIYKKDAGQKQVLLNISGGNEKTQFYISGGYTSQDGIIILEGFERFSGRLNLKHSASPKLDLGMNMNLSRTSHNLLFHDASGASPATLVDQPPVQPLYDPQNPDKYFEQTLNPNQKTLEEYYHSLNAALRSLSNLYLNWKPRPWLKLHTEAGIDFRINDWRYFLESGAVRYGAANGYATIWTSQASNYSLNNYLSFDHAFLDHQVRGTLGMTYQQVNEKDLYTEGTDFPNDDFRELGSAGQITDGYGGNTGFSVLSYFGRLNYDYGGKYLLALSGRVDGDSRFGQDNRYGFFPAASLGYVLSKEGFLANNKLLSFLKVRASWGITGNTPVSRFASRGLFSGFGSYNQTSGIVQTQVANPDLGWEKTTQTDVGLDFGLLEDRISGQLDYYWKNTEDLLLQVNIAGTTGFGSQLQNAGKIRNEGVELMITSHNLTGALKWKTMVNFSKNINEVTDLRGEELNYNPALVREGHPIGVFYLPEYAGVDPDNGDALYYLNTSLGNGQLDRNTTNNINLAERVVVGNPHPDFIYALQNTFSWKGFELDILFQGVYGNDNYNRGGRWQMDGFRWFNNQDSRILDRWQKPGDVTDIPQLRFRQGTNDSSRFLESGTYLRLKNLSLSYQFPRGLIQKFGLQQLRLYLRGQNLLTFTDYEGWDPEKITQDLGKPGHTYHAKIDIKPGALKPGVYRVICCTQFYLGKGKPGPIAGFHDLGLIKIYQDKKAAYKPQVEQLVAVNDQG